MSMDRIESSEIDASLNNSHWEIDKEAKYKIVKNCGIIKLTLQNPNGFAHRFKETFYAISRVRHVKYENKLYIELFEVNKPFRNKGIGKFALYELLKKYHPIITSVELSSVSPESDRFFESIKMQKEGLYDFSGDATWLSNFIASMATEDKNDIIKTIESIHNNLCNEAL